MPEMALKRPALIDGQDIDRLREHFSGWDVELIHLGRGPIRRYGVLVPLGEIRITGLHLEKAAVLRGAAPRECLSLLSTSPAATPVRVAARPVGGGTCFMLGSQAPVDIYLPENCCAFILSFPFAAAAPREPQVTRNGLPAAGCSEFRSLETVHSALLSRCMDLIATYSRSPSPELVGRQIQRRLYELLVPCVPALFSQSATLPPEVGENAVRRLAVSRACVYIDGHLSEPIALKDLYEIAGVRARTLEYGFRECYDVGPMAYLRSARLCRVRCDLMKAGAAASVAAAARRWNFTHMGQFSRDYRLQFGESPSVTLARQRSVRSQQPAIVASAR